MSYPWALSSTWPFWSRWSIISVITLHTKENYMKSNLISLSLYTPFFRKLRKGESRNFCRGSAQKEYNCKHSCTTFPFGLIALGATSHYKRVARNLQWGAFWGVWGGAPSRQRPGVWGQSPQPPEARGSGGGAPNARKFCIFLLKKTSF